jgi:hypothetical protein
MASAKRAAMKMKNDTSELPELMPDEVLEILIGLYPDAERPANASGWKAAA